MAGCLLSCASGLPEAAQRGDLQQIEILLQQGRDVDQTDSNGLTALHHAAEQGDLRVLRLLLGRGADIDAGAGVTGTPLMRAALRGRTEAAEYLISEGAAVDAEDADGATALVMASARGRGPTVTQLLAAGVDPNLGSGRIALATHDVRRGRGPSLLLAAAGGHTSVVDLLIAGGAEIDAQTEKGATALSAASSVEVVDLLLKRGANPRVGTLVVGAVLGVKNGDSAEIVGLLLGAGADPDEWVAGLGTPLTLALMLTDGNEQLPRVAEMLILANADIETPGILGLTPLMLASSNGQVDLVELLIARGADGNKVSAKMRRRSALFFAAMQGETDAVAMLLYAGADPTQRDDTGVTPREAAISAGYPATGALIDEFMYPR